MNHKTPLSRTTVQIPTASGDAIEAWVYLPEGSGSHPAVVMAHGIGGIKAGGLSPFAERSSGGHYDVYEGGAGHADVLRVALEFLRRHVKTAT
jgi:fermentation-respiration switch protein FrsA (DUF1100 family)